MKEMKEFKTKSELYAEYKRLMEKYEPEPVIEKLTALQQDEYNEAVKKIKSEWREGSIGYNQYMRILEKKYHTKPVIEKPVIEKKPVRKKIEKKPVIEKKEEEEKEDRVWCSRETFELEKAGAKRRGEIFVLKDMEKDDGYESWKKNKIELEPHGNRCVKCNGVFDLGYNPLCPNCYEKFGYWKIEGNGENFKKFLGENAKHNINPFERTLPRGKCMIKL